MDRRISISSSGGPAEASNSAEMESDSISLAQGILAWTSGVDKRLVSCRWDRPQSVYRMKFVLEIGEEENSVYHSPCGELRLPRFSTEGDPIGNPDMIT